MTTFRIFNRHTGADFGRYDGETAAQALAAMHRDAGYAVTVDDEDAPIWPDEDTKRLCGWIGEAWDVVQAHDPR